MVGILSASQSVWFIFALVGVVVAGLTKLALPFCGNTALFMTGARMMDQGGVLYVDFWDFKQPGIYWFFLAGGRLFGLTQLGIRESGYPLNTRRRQ